MALKYLGIEGVAWDDDRKKFVAFVDLGGEDYKDLGEFDTIHAAYEASKEALKANG